MEASSMQAKRRKFSEYQKRMRENPTPAEAAVKRALDELEIRYVSQKGFLRDKTLRIVDFYIAKSRFGRRICLEVDGKYHERQREYDAYRETRVKAQRKSLMKFVRVTNEWVLSRRSLPEDLCKLLDQRVDSTYFA